MADAPPPPRILFFGDPHTQLRAVAATTLALRPRAIVLLGDVQACAPLDVELADVLDAGVQVTWIFGNHDADLGEQMWLNLTSADLNPRSAAGALHGKVLDVAGIRVAGLGGIFRSSAWLPPDEPRARTFDELARRNKRLFPKVWQAKSAEHRDSIYPADYDALAKQRAEILVTHEAPTSHRDGYRAIDELAHAMRVRLVVHGHLHQPYLSRNADGLLVAGVGAVGAVDELGNDRHRGVPAREPKRVDGWTRLR